MGAVGAAGPRPVTQRGGGAVERGKGRLGRLPPPAPGGRIGPVRGDVRAVRDTGRGIARSARRRRHETGAARQAAGLGGAVARIIGIGLVGAHWGATGILGQAPRSEEHTSELQSLMRISYAVFCLKKKSKRTQTTSKRATTENN